MKVGDLVTLSAYGKNLKKAGQDTWPPRDWGEKLVGILYRVEEYDHEPSTYYIEWFNEGPSGRDWWSKCFHRKDLKKVR